MLSKLHFTGKSVICKEMAKRKAKEEQKRSKCKEMERKEKQTRIRSRRTGRRGGKTEDKK